MAKPAQVQGYAFHPSHISKSTVARLLRGERVGDSRDGARLVSERYGGGWAHIEALHWNVAYVRTPVRVVDGQIRATGPSQIRCPADTATSKRRYRELLGARPIVNGIAIGGGPGEWHQPTERLTGDALALAFCAACDFVDGDAAHRRVSAGRALSVSGVSEALRSAIADQLEIAGSRPREWSYAHARVDAPERAPLRFGRPFVGGAAGETLLSIVEGSELDPLDDEHRVGAYLASTGAPHVLTTPGQREAYLAAARIWDTGAVALGLDVSARARVVQRSALIRGVI